jgi:hypothetical protein
LNQHEEQAFQDELGRLETPEREGIMEIVTSWMERGIEQGAVREVRSLILKQLTRKFGFVSDEIRSQVAALSVLQLEMLGEALLDLANLADLERWLCKLSSHLN